MKTYISIISHGHIELIKKLGCLNKLAEEFTVIVKLNKKEKISSDDIFFKKILVLDEKYNRGFGENNNIVFNYCRESLGMDKNDIFIVLNPDVYVETATIRKLFKSIVSDQARIATINLFKDSDYTIYDNSIRKYPNLFDFIKSFLFGSKKTIIDKNNITEPKAVDWGAGSFLAFKAEHYNNLAGFSEQYYMYCEDIDICYRSKIMGYPLLYYPQYKAIHLACHKNRSVFSKHFYWHFRSALIFTFMKKRLEYR